jgi:hypothetical protein
VEEKSDDKIDNVSNYETKAIRKKRNENVYRVEQKYQIIAVTF